MDLPSILAPYGLDLVVHPSKQSDIGTHMKAIGHVFRHFNDSVPDYEDRFVRKWLEDRGEDLSYYQHFDVTTITKEYARASLARYDRCEDPFTPEIKALYDVAGEWLWLEFGEHMKDSRVISSEAAEAHLRYDKSPGAPWTLSGILTKGDYFTQKCDFYVKYWDLLATPNYIRSLCSSSGKEEMRSSEKVRVGKIRTTISMEVSHVKAHTQLCLDQNEMLMATVGKHSSCLGIVMQYGGWDKLNTRMSRFAPVPSTMELDGKEFDSRYRWYVFQKVRDFRFRCLRSDYQTPENYQRMCNLYRELCFAPFLDVDGHAYSRECGNPSGQACTTPDNIFKNFMDIVVLWHLIMPPSFHNYRDFKKFLEMCIVGDDINISVHPDIQHLFNVEAILSKMHLIDMVYTTPDTNFRHNYECEFLGHGFEKVMGIYLPVIDCQKMRTSMLKFNTSGEIWETIVRANGLRNETFACVHCREWFAKLIRDLRKEFGQSQDPQVVEAWKSYKTDAELWSLYTGMKYVDVCVALASAMGSPTYKFARYHSQSLKTSKFLCHCIHTSGTEGLCCAVTFTMTKSVKKKVKKAAKKEAVKEIKKVLRKKGSRRTSRTKPNVLHGKGGYWGDLGKRLGGHLGGVADEVVGIGKALTGRGAYRVKSNSIMETGGPPSIVNSKHTSIIRHREYIGDIWGSTGFAIRQYSINPGVDVTFPWLSAVAQGYEQYRVRGMVFEFHSTSATSIGSTNTALGTVIMATEYNSNLPPFINKLQMENHEYATTVCPDHSAIHPIECARARTPLDELYVRTSFDNVPATAYSGNTNFNVLQYDLGQFYLATYGMQASANIGELWVSYEIEFLKPALNSTTTAGTMIHWYWDSNLGSAPTSGALTSNLRNKNNGTIREAGSNGLINLTPGRYFMLIQGTQASTSSTVPVISFGNGSAVNIFDTTASTGVSASSYIGVPNADGANDNFIWAYCFDLTQPGNGVSFGSCTIGAISKYDIFVFQYPMGFTASESRKAVDWDPVALLSKRLLELETKLHRVEEEEEEEKYCESACSTPVQVCKVEEPPLTQSTADLAESLLARIGRRGAVTSKTAFSTLP